MARMEAWFFIGHWLLVIQWSLGIWALVIFFVIRNSSLIPHSEFVICRFFYSLPAYCLFA